MFTTNDLLKIAADSILLNHKGIQTIAQKFPLLSGSIAEHHFGKGQIDFSVRLSKEEVSPNLPTFSDEKIIQSFFQSWINPKSPFHHFIENIWLEFDIPKEEEISMPSVFFDTDRYNKWSNSRKIEAVKATLNAFQYDTSSIYFQKWLMILNHLPQQAHLYYIGLMLSRPTTDLRLCFLHLKPTEIISFLLNIGWTGNTTILENALSIYSLPTDTLILDIDVAADGTIREKVSFEILQRPFYQWSDLFELLVENQLCSVEEASTLLNFHGDFSLAGTPLADYFTNKNQMLPKGVKLINHVKFTCFGEEKLNIKGYVFLGF